MRACGVLGAGLVAGALLAGAGAAGAQPVPADLSIGEGRISTSPDRPASANIFFTIRSAGPGPAEDVEVTYTLPAGVRFAAGNVAAVPNCAAEADGTLVRCGGGVRLGSPGETSAALTVVNVGVPAGDEVAVEARVASAAPDPNPADNVASVSLAFDGGPVPTVPGGASADLALGAISFSASAPDGSQVTVAGTVLNHGPDPAEAALITVDVPEGLSLVQGGIDAVPTCVASGDGRQVTCPWPRAARFSPGESFAVVQLAVAPPLRGREVTVTVSVTSGTPDPLTANNALVLTALAGAPPSPPPSGEPAATTSTSTAGSLAETGRSGVPPTAWAGAGLLAAGLVAVVVTTRRRGPARCSASGAKRR